MVSAENWRTDWCGETTDMFGVRSVVNMTVQAKQEPFFLQGSPFDVDHGPWAVVLNPSQLHTDPLQGTF